MILAIVTTASAQVTYPEQGYTSYQVVNLSTTTQANISVNYYDPNGVAASYSPSFTNVPTGGVVTVQEALEPDLPSGQYSAVISSNTPIAAIANQQLGVAGSGVSIPPFSSYSGESAGATTVYLPAVMYNWYGYYTEVYIQNAGSAAATNIQISYVPTAIGSCVTGATGQSDTVANGASPLAQYATRMVSQFSKSALGAPTVAGCTTYNGRFLGAAKITADQPVVVIVNEIVQNKLFTYNGFTTPANKLIAPAYEHNYYGYYASLTIYNPSATTDSQVTLTYKSDAVNSNPASKTVVANHTVPMGKSITLYDGPGATAAQSDLLTDFPQDATHKFLGTVVIQSTNNVPVVATVNQESVLASGNKAGSYNAMADTEGTQKISIPLVQSNFYGFYTSISIMTVDGTDATVKITYTSDGTYSSVKNTSKSYTMSTAGGFLNRYEGPTATVAQSDLLHDASWASGGQHKFIGSAVIEVTSGANIVAFVNSESSPMAAYPSRDTMYTYNAFNLVP